MKKAIKISICSLIILLFVSTLRAQDKQNVSKWPRGITYEIFVQSFADSDGDGIGDINGMISKLDYLQELGIEGIWLMPMNPSPTYHKYDVSDYYDIHPNYGTLAEFKNFVKEAHKRNIKVVMDMVFNHSGSQNQWFKEALKDEHIKYWDYYVWAHKNDPRVQPVTITAPDGTQRKVRSNWNAVPNSDYLYFSHFTRNMPDLNFDNPKLQQEVFKIGKFWLSDVGVDGFRLDAARHIFPDERATDNHKWWEYFLQEMKTVNKDVYIVGEVWAPAELVGPYLKGIPALFNFDMGGEIIKAVNEGNGSTLVSKHKEIEDFYKKINPEYIDATFLTNHDQDRVMSSVNGNADKEKMAVALLLTLPGSPYLYYGEEIGMLGQKPDQNIREPILWDKKENDKTRTFWIKPRFSTDSTIIPVSQQSAEKSSLLNYYKTLIKLRNKSYALTYGELIPVETANKSICAFIRSDERERLVVIHNLSDKSQKFNLPANLKEFNVVYFAGKAAQTKNNQVTIPGYSTVILTK
ncbi:MAG: alpha-glucosidase C-terminal domain-containing protein [Bacteroidales bacterium]|nr:alpha-glucosidase C-terminal domain-containing protein [Bacteroidales bacterium]